MFEQNDDKTVMSFIVQNCPVFYFTKEEQNFPLDVEQFLRKCQLKHIASPHDVLCSSIQNLFLEKRYLIQGKTRSPLTDKEFYIQPSRKVNMLNHITKSILYTRLTVNSKFIRVSYMMFFKENEGAVEKDALVGQQHGDWKHVALYFDKSTQELLYAVVGNHFTENQVIPADKLQFETVSGNYRPVFYVSQGTHSIYSEEGEHEVDELRENTSNGKKWMPRNIVFLPETLQRARRTKSSWVYYHGQYGSDRAYGPVYQAWWNQDPEFIEYMNDVGMGEFRIRSERLEEISSVIEETTERIRSRSRVRPQTEVNRTRLHKTASTIQHLSKIQPSSLTQKAEVLLEKQKNIEAEEKSIQDIKKELENKLREFHEQQEELQQQQQDLLQEKETFNTQRTQYEEEWRALQAKEEEVNCLKVKLTKDIEEVVKRKHKIEEDEKELENVRQQIHTIQAREKELEKRTQALKKERESITTMITQGMQKSQEDYSAKKKELTEQEHQLHATQHQLNEKSKELRDLEQQLQEMTEQIEQRQMNIQEQEERIQQEKEEIEEAKQRLEEAKQTLEQEEEATKQTVHTTKDMNEKVEKLQQEITNLHEREKRLTQRETNLEKQIEELQKEIDTIQKEANTSLDSLKQKYETELEKVNSSLETRVSQIQQLEVYLESVKEKQKEQEEQKKQEQEKANDKITTQQETIDSLQKSLEESLQKEKEMKEKVEDLKNQLHTQTQIVEHLRENLEITEKKLIDSSHHDFTEDMSIGAKVAVVLRHRDQEIQDLRHYIETVEGKVQDVEKAKNESQTELERIQNEFHALQAKYQEETAENLKSQEELTTLLDGAQQQVVELNKQVEEHKQTEKEWKQKYEQRHQQAIRTQQEQRKAQHQLSELSKEYQDIRKTIQSKTQEIEKLTQEKQDMEKKYTQRIQQIEKAKNEQDEKTEKEKQEIQQKIDALQNDYSSKNRETEQVIQTHQRTIEEQSKQLEKQRQQMEKQKQELNTRMTRMIDKADLVQSQLRVTELQQALEVSQKENREKKEKEEQQRKIDEEKQKRLSYMENQVAEWKKQHSVIQEVARMTEEKYKRVLQDMEGYKVRERTLLKEKQELEKARHAQEAEKKRVLQDVDGYKAREQALLKEKQDLEKQIEVVNKQLNTTKQPVKRNSPPAPQPAVGNLMFTQNRAPPLGRRRQVRRVRG